MAPRILSKAISYLYLGIITLKIHVHRDPKQIKVQRIKYYGILNHKCSVCIMLSVCKDRSSLWKKKLKDCKCYKQWIATRKLLSTHNKSVAHKNPLLWNISWRCITCVYAVVHLFNDTKMCYIILCCICLILRNCVTLPSKNTWFV